LEVRVRREFIYLLERGLGGYHLLFDDDLIAEALAADETEILLESERYGQQLNDTVRRLLDAKSVGEARRTIRDLPRPVARLFAYIYFQAISKSLDRQHATIH